MNYEAEIIEMESQLRGAILAGDVAKLSELIADDVLFVNPAGHMLSKATDLEAHSQGLLKMQKMDLLEQEIRSFGEVAVAVSRLALVGTYLENEFIGEYRYTRVWQRTATSWQIAAGHCGPIV